MRIQPHRSRSATSPDPFQALRATAANLIRLLEDQPSTLARFPQEQEYLRE
ncbi:hypothetical protein [Nocardia sp. NPDC057455]|uniref:hypothetical protein n=1 Tax=Nocardia sp. NPDC057455 TaxID=3346138 RepID=UPI00366CCEE0